jgi:hypothetical protein
MKARAHPHAPLTSFAAAELPASEKHHIEKITKIGVGSCGVLFAFFSLLCLVENQLLVTSIIVLLLKISNTIFSHFSLNILSFTLTGISMIFQYFDEVLNVICVWLLV